MIHVIHCTIYVGCYDSGSYVMVSISSKGDLKGTRLLDVGTGPSICSVISATPHFEEVYLSDYVDNNLTALKQWMGGTLEHSFQNAIEFFLKLEGNG